MKHHARNTSRPAGIVVSDEALARARRGLQTFGVEPAVLEQLANFKGDVTIGPAAERQVVRSAAKAR